MTTPNESNRGRAARLAVAATAVAAAVAGLVPARAASTTGADRWIHVRVQETGPEAESVRVNLPLSLIEAVLPTIQAEHLRNGRVQIDHEDVTPVDLRALLKAVRDAGDAEFVTIEGKGGNVRVAREGDDLIVRIRDEGGEGPVPALHHHLHHHGDDSAEADAGDDDEATAPAAAPAAPPAPPAPPARRHGVPQAPPAPAPPAPGAATPSVETVDVRVPMRVVEALLGTSGDELDLVAGLRALGEHDGELVRVLGGDAKISVWIDGRNSAPPEEY